MKRKILIILILLFTFSGGYVVAESVNGSFEGNPIVKIIFGGKELTASDTPAIIYNNRTMVPLSLLKQAGFDVTWNANNYSAGISLPTTNTNNTDEIAKKLSVYGENLATTTSYTSYGDKATFLHIEANFNMFDKIGLSKLDRILVIATDTIAFTVEVTDTVKNQLFINTSDLMDFRAGKLSGEQMKSKYEIHTPDGTNPLKPSTTSSTLKKLTVSDIAKLTNRVGIIYTYDRFNKQISQGSGFMLFTNGLMITNHHVINGAAYETVKINGQTFTTHYVGFDNPTIDLCGIAFNLDDQGKYKTDITFPYLKLNTNLPQVGDKVFAIGSPRELENTVSEGIVSGIRKINGTTMIQHTANTDHGSSGGALLNEYGEVIGVTSAMIEGTSLDFAIAASYVKDELDKSQK